MYISNNNSGCSCPSNSMNQHDDESANTIPTIDKTTTEKDVTQTNGNNMQLIQDHQVVMMMANNRSFSEHNLWYQEELMKKNEDLPLSKYDKTSKKILIWSYNWEGLTK